MMTNIDVTYTVIEFCQLTDISEEELQEVVALGVIAPRDDTENQWVFDVPALSHLRRARQLRYELALDWPGIAMTLTLLERIAVLSKENQQLRRQLSRFVKTAS